MNATIIPIHRRTAAERRREMAYQAHQCARWLKVSGFRVLAIVGGLRQPRVLIERNAALCGALEGAVDGYERTRDGERRFRFVLRFGCRVEWEGGGHAAGHPLAYPMRVEGGAA